MGCMSVAHICLPHLPLCCLLLQCLLWGWPAGGSGRSGRHLPYGEVQLRGRHGTLWIDSVFLLDGTLLSFHCLRRWFTDRDPVLDLGEPPVFPCMASFISAGVNLVESPLITTKRSTAVRRR